MLFIPQKVTFIAGLALGLAACSKSAPSDTGDAPASGGSSTGGLAGSAVTGGAMNGGASGAGVSGGAGPTGGAGASTTGGVSGASGADPGENGGSDGGTAGTGGSSGGGGVAGGAGAGPLTGLGGTPSRPTLTPDQAANFTVLAYLAKTGTVTAPTTDNWDPTAGAGDVSTFTPAFTVAASGGTHTTVQAAVTAAVTAGGTERAFIRVMPGTYRELVCIPSAAPPITLYSTSSDAAATTIVYNHLAGSTVDANVNPCVTPSSATYGTSGSATFAVYGANFQAKNLTISNDGDETTVSGSVQGVALNTRGDKAVFDNVALLGNQDTLLVGTSNVGVIARAYFKNTTIEGDVDFICGRGTAVFDGGTIRLVSNRRATGNLLAPSTDARNPYGFLVTGVTITGDSGATAGGMTLGRAWDESQVDVPTYTANVMTGTYPNGQAVIRDSMLGPNVNGSAPWASAATTSRPYSSTPTDTLPANRLYEFNDRGP